VGGVRFWGWVVCGGGLGGQDRQLRFGLLSGVAGREGTKEKGKPENEKNLRAALRVNRGGYSARRMWLRIQGERKKRRKSFVPSRGVIPQIKRDGESRRGTRAYPTRKSARGEKTPPGKTTFPENVEKELLQQGGTAHAEKLVAVNKQR